MFKTHHFTYICILPLIIVAFSSACSSHKYTEELNRIDSLLTVVEHAEIKLNTIDTAVISSDYQIYTNNLAHVRTSFSEKEDDSWGYLTRYGLIRKPLRDFNRHYVTFMKEIEETRSQLNILRENIKRQKINEEDIPRYINDEAAFVDYIHLSVENLIDITTSYHEQFKELNPKVETYIGKAE